MGTGKNGEWTFLDIVSLISFCVGLQNLEENLTQSDLHDTDVKNAKRQDQILNDIHAHLALQDGKLDAIIAVLKDKGGVFYER